MAQILHWGYEAPVKNDYIKDKRELQYKIRKMEKEQITEQHDNYRKPEFDDERGVFLFNFVSQDNQEMWKKKLYDMAVEGETEEFKITTYKQLFGSPDEKAWWDQVFRNVTPAGKPCYTRAQYNGKPLITPMDYVKQRIEDKIKDMISHDSNGLMAQHLQAMEAKEQQALDTMSNQLMSDRTMSGGRQGAKVEKENRKEQSKKDIEREKRSTALKKKRA
jgi:hypothetical protein